VAARCSGAGEDDTCDDQVRLLPHGRPRLHDDIGTPADGQPRLLPLLLSSYISSGGNEEGSPSV
jgi:hypothetical protein